MKIQSKTILTLLVVSFLIDSFTVRNGEKDNHRNSYFPAIVDTTSVKSWIRVDSFNLNVLPPSSGVRFYRDGFIFLSSSKSDGKMAENHISFGRADARYAVINDKRADSVELFSPTRPFPYPCEATTFTSDYDTMYYTGYSKKEGVEKIFEATYIRDTGEKTGSWLFNDNPLNFCTGKSTYTHPALSVDGKLMVFASDREGSIGGMDLFASIKKNGVWTDPVNIGDAVNSTANELYPFLDSENNLYFSSDGAQGFGGYDIYVCKFKSNTWEKPINLSTPVNTMFDDIAFSINRKDGKEGFYTVKQNSGKRSQQLYIVTMDNSRPDTLLSLSQYYTRPNISQMVILALEPAVQATDKISETASTVRGEKDIITYRVEFMTSFNPRTRQQISAEGKDYAVYEFLYSGAYRLCAGEFSSLSSAIELRNILRKNEYPRATVIAFKNNVISLDPELLKEPLVPVTEVKEQKTITEPTKVVTTPEALNAGTLKKDKVVSEVRQTQTSNPAVILPSEKKDVVVYRLQIITNNTSRAKYKISVGNKQYDTFEYQYAGAYRICIGEFSNLNAAKEFQNSCRQSGYPQAFVVAFKNNVRSNDPALFK